MESKGIKVICNLDSKKTFDVELISKEEYKIIGYEKKDKEIIDFAIVIHGEVVVTSSSYSKIYSHAEKLSLDYLIN